MDHAARGLITVTAPLMRRLRQAVFVDVERLAALAALATVVHRSNLRQDILLRALDQVGLLLPIRDRFLNLKARHDEQPFTFADVMMHAPALRDDDSKPAVRLQDTGDGAAHSTSSYAD